ncbi:MAG: DNA cytosine methyltransferase [Kiritimatiellae bacterium]|nr:DNA cytosine methyltransferase [Kiritimatiellia bacterium]
MSVACDGLPLDPVFFSEIEPFPCAVLKAHYPTIPNLGDMSKIRRDENGNITNGRTTIPFPAGGIDILAAGCPCQDYSVAGKRAGGAEGSGTRSSLIFEFIRIIGEFRPRYFIYENVPGMFTTHEGRDFAHVVMEMEQRGYSLAWRVLDAQYVRVDGMGRAVPQRRRRVWVVGHSGADESRAAEILFEPDCVAGHTPPRRIAGQGFAYSLARRDRVDAGVVGEPAADRDGGCLNPLDVQSKRIYQPSGCAPCLPSGSTEGMTIQPSVCIALDGDKLKPREDQRKGGNGFGINEEGAGYTLTGVDRHGVAYGIDQQGGKGGANTTESVAPTVLSDSHGTPHGVAYAADGGNVAATITRQISEQSWQDNRANAVVECYENHAQDSRVQGPIDTAPTQGSSNANSAGVIGNNPLVCFSKVSHPHAPNGEGERWDEREVSPCISAKMSGYEPTLAQSQCDLSQMRYIVRRLTPTEVERLMGLPDGWTIPTGLRRYFGADGEPSPELVDEFVERFDTFNAIMAAYEHKAPPKGKSRKQVADWLKKISCAETCPDSPRYKGCGNGQATNQPRWIVTRLLALGEGIDPFTGEKL